MRWARLNPSPLRRLRRGYSLGACTALLQVAGEARRVPGLHANLLAEDPDELGFWEIVEVLEIVVAELGEELGVYLEPRDLELRAHRGQHDETQSHSARRSVSSVALREALNFFDLARAIGRPAVRHLALGSHTQPGSRGTQRRDDPKIRGARAGPGTTAGQ